MYRFIATRARARFTKGMRSLKVVDFSNIRTIIRDTVNLVINAFM
jgi:hypothetical protein